MKVKILQCLLGIVVVVAICAGSCFGWIALNKIHEDTLSADTYKSIADDVLSVSESTVVNNPEDDEKPKEFSPIQIDFDALREKNWDIIGWIYSPDTPINYPVVQGVDNDFYIHHLIDGQYNASGTIFLDYSVPGDFSAKNNVLYGHHMANGSMFASLAKYKKAEYYSEHPVMYLSTPDQDYKVELFSAMVTPATSSAYTMFFNNSEDFLAWVTELKDNSLFESNVQVGEDDRILMLSTCSYEYDDARTIVCGKLVPLDRPESSDEVASDIFIDDPFFSLEQE